MTPAEMTQLQTMVSGSPGLRGAGIAVAESNAVRILRRPTADGSGWVVATDAVPTDQYKGGPILIDRLRALLSRSGMGVGTFTPIGGLNARFAVYKYTPSGSNTGGGTARSLYAIAFQNYDQKANQVYNMLSSVVKTLAEMQSIGAGDRSGL